MVTELLVLLALVLVNGLFSGAEIATVTLRRSRIAQLVEEGSGAARAVEKLRKNPERFLATVQVGITVVGAAAAAYGGDTLAERLVPYLTPLLGEHAKSVAFVVVVAAISYLSLVLGELVPKSLALRSSEGYALLVARPLLGLATLARPLVWLLTTSSNAVLRLFGDRTSFTEARASAEELRAMIEESSDAGELHPQVGEIAARAVELHELRAVDVMVPRRRIRALRKEASHDELRRFVGEVGHSKIPLYEGSLDHVVGFVAVRDAFARGEQPGGLAALARPIAFVPETVRAVELLRTLQGRGAELAIVVDEHGGTVGLVTREDVAEELFGEANPTTPGPEGALRREPDGTLVLDGAALLREVNREAELRLPESEDFTTIAGLCVAVAGRIPEKAERVALEDGSVLEVIDASPRRVRTVRLHPPPPPPAPAAAD